jgi:hypothetical protein
MGHRAPTSKAFTAEIAEYAEKKREKSFLGGFCDLGG